MRAMLLLLLLGGPAWGQTPPACVTQREGMVACMGEKLCECRWEPAGSLTGRPAGLRWDCGVLRPSCGVVPAAPPPIASPPLTVMPWLQMPPAAQPAATAQTGAAATPRGTR